MRSIKYPFAIALLMSFYGYLSSCSDGTEKKKAPAAGSVIITNKDAWKDPRKGKIYSKVNVVQIPLTAYENRILGKVKSVSYRDYKMPDNKLADSGYNVYDQAGHLVDQNEYNADGSQKWKCVYKYDSSNKATEWDFQFFEQKEHTKTFFKYDEKGNQIEALTYNDEKKLTDRETTTYDDKGNDLVHTGYDRNGKIIRIETYKYDAKGNQVELIQRYDGRTPGRRMTVEYDNTGNQVGGAYYRNDTGKISKWVQKNNSDGRCIERASYKPDGTKQVNSTMKYDQWGNETEMISYNEDGTVNETASYFFEYAYDGTGNITKQTTYKLIDGKREAIDYTVTSYTYY